MRPLGNSNWGSVVPRRLRRPVKTTRGFCGFWSSVWARARSSMRTLPDPGMISFRESVTITRTAAGPPVKRSEEHTSELQSHLNLVCRLLLEKKKTSDNEVSRQSYDSVASD